MSQYEKLIQNKYLHIKYCISESQIKDIKFNMIDSFGGINDLDNALLRDFNTFKTSEPTIRKSIDDTLLMQCGCAPFRTERNGQISRALNSLVQ